MFRTQPSSEELAELTALGADLEAANDRMNAAVDSALTQLRESARPEREIEMRARVATQLARQPVEIDPSRLDFGAW